MPVSALTFCHQSIFHIRLCRLFGTIMRTGTEAVIRRYKGTDIPSGARILSVVDCFDALTSDRPYRPRLSDREAMRILLESAEERCTTR